MIMPRLANLARDIKAGTGYEILMKRYQLPSPKALLSLVYRLLERNLVDFKDVQYLKGFLETQPSPSQSRPLHPQSGTGKSENDERRYGGRKPSRLAAEKKKEDIQSPGMKSKAAINSHREPARREMKLPQKHDSSATSPGKVEDPTTEKRDSNEIAYDEKTLTGIANDIKAKVPYAVLISKYRLYESDWKVVIDELLQEQMVKVDDLRYIMNFHKWLPPPTKTKPPLVLITICLLLGYLGVSGTEGIRSAYNYVAGEKTSQPAKEEAAKQEQLKPRADKFERCVLDCLRRLGADNEWSVKQLLPACQDSCR